MLGLHSFYMSKLFFSSAIEGAVVITQAEQPMCYPLFISTTWWIVGISTLYNKDILISAFFQVHGK